MIPTTLPSSPLTTLQDGGTYQARENISRRSFKLMSKEEKDIREQASQVLGQVFFAPMLAKMRESPFKTDMTSGGRGGEAFGQMLDAQFTKGMVGPNSRLVDTFAKPFLKHAAAVKEAQKLLNQPKGDHHVDFVG